MGRVGHGKVTAGRVLVSAVALVATGFLFAAGYDIYSRLFRRTSATLGGLGMYIPEPKVVTYDNTVLRRY
jgi:hypothetical protein